MLLQLFFETLEQGEGVSRAPCKACQYLVFVESAYLAGITLHHGVALGDLPIPAYDDTVASSYRPNGGSSILVQGSLLLNLRCLRTIADRDWWAVQGRGAASLPKLLR